ncbi:MAG: acetate--CoA ligase family protein, partial [Pseudomonadota bacterium]
KPRHAVFIGGSAAEYSASMCAEAGFTGEIWGVNPRRETLAGFPCFDRIADLPEPPDAVYLAVPYAGAVDAVSELAQKGAGGIACFTAGFGELGDTGAQREHDLIAACGDMALIGPNCQGILNFIHNAHLWPFGFPYDKFTQGAAIISQSGMFCSNLVMNQRSVPFSYLISAGNQAVLGIEDYLDVLLDDPAVTCVGLYIESLNDPARFAEVATRALEMGKPIVALKGGTSDVGAQLTVTHTGALSGDNRLYRALFQRLGVIEVSDAAILLETLKLVSVAGVPKSARVAAFTMSGGDATMIADVGEKIGLDFAQPQSETRVQLTEQLPDIATVSNPLDLTTPLWGDGERVTQVIGTLLADGFDAAVYAQDYPMPDMGVRIDEYRQDVQSLTLAAHSAGVPAAVMSSLPENIDPDTRAWLIEQGIAPLQGFIEGLTAIKGSSLFGAMRERLDSARPFLSLRKRNPQSDALQVLDEWNSKQRLKDWGIPIPLGQAVAAGGFSAAELMVEYPVVAKLVSSSLTHKSDAGAVVLGIADDVALTEAVTDICASVANYDATLACDEILLEQMVDGTVCEVMVGIRYDTRFGWVMVLASGGIWVELLDDAQVVLLPASRDTIDAAISRLQVNKVIVGSRGKPPGDRAALIDCIATLADAVATENSDVLELDVNPLMVLREGVVAADALLRIEG